MFADFKGASKGEVKIMQHAFFTSCMALLLRSILFVKERLWFKVYLIGVLFVVWPCFLDAQVNHEQGFILTVADEEPPPPVTEPDLIVLEATYEYDQVQYQQFSGTLTLKNIGNSPISNFNVTKVYFSKDQYLDERDVYGGSVSFTNLEAGQTISLSLSGGSNQFGINADSEYPYFIVKADSRQEITEADETNNIWVGEINIRNASVDLTVESFINNSTETLRQGEILDLDLGIKNNGADNVHNTMYEYFLSTDEILDEADTRIGYLNWIGFYWNSSAVENDQLAIPASLPPAYYHLIVRINTQGQGINIEDYNLENNVVSLFGINVANAVENNTLNFDQDFGARSWEEDGHQWSWDNSGWDNIRNYHPYSGSGHGMSSAGYSARLSTTALLNITGLWVKTNESYTFTHLRLLGYDKNEVVVFTKDLDPMDFEMGYAYVSLNWEEVQSIQFDYGSTDEWIGAEVFYDDMDYQYLGDNTPPSITCLENNEVCSGSELPDYRNLIVVSDDSGEFSLSQSPVPGTTIIETTTITITAADGANNESYCNFTVEVLEQEVCQPARPSKPGLADTSDSGISNSDGITKDNTPEFYGTAEANSLVSVYINEVIEGSVTATEDGSWSYTLPLENTLADGNYNVQVSATNADGYESVVSEALAIIIDNQEPVIQTQNINLELDATGNALLEYQDIENGSTDNETAAENLSFSLSRTAFECADLGQSLNVVLTVEDQAGNNATKDATVSIVDQLVPELTVQDIILQLDNTGFAGLEEAAVVVSKADNCSIPVISFSRTDFSCADAGSSFLVTITATDASENSTEEVVNVTVIDDIAPLALAHNITVQLNANGQAVVEAAAVDAGSSDNCDISSMSLSQTIFGCADLGSNTVIFSVTDHSGNTSETSVTITIEDSVVPVVMTQDISIQLNSSGIATAAAEQIDNGSTDACGIEAISLDKTSFTCVDIGSNTVVLTVTDVNGNTASATATVTVEDKIAPVISAGQLFTIGENSQQGTSVGSISVSYNCGLQNFAITGGNAEDAFAINANGLISVNNQKALDYESTPEFVLEILVEDLANNVGIATVLIQLSDVNESPVLVNIPDKNVNEGEQMNFRVSGSDPEGGAIQYSLGANAPAGAFLNASTGEFIWEPTEEQGPAVFNFHLQASDGVFTTEQEISIEVLEINQAPAITSEPNLLARSGEEFTYQLQVSDPDLPANTLAFDALIIPSWLSFDPVSQVLSGIPENVQEGSYLIKLQVSDGAESVVQEFSIQLENPTGLFDNQQDNFDALVYPNPTSGWIIIIWEDQILAEEVKASLLDLGGRLLIQHEGDLNHITKEVNEFLQEIKAGVYLLQLQAEGKVKTVRLIKK